MPPVIALLFLSASLVPLGHAAARLTVRRLTVEGLRGREPVVAVWAASGSQEPLPVVVAFHGKGESRLGPRAGHAAWLERYGLGAAYEALLGAPLTKAAFGGLVRDSELAALNGELAGHPFVGVVAVGVYTPDLLQASRDDLEKYARWVADDLLRSVRSAVPIASNVARQAGVDGVSLGGMVALEVGLRHPDVFGAVGTMQPAIRGREAEIAELAERGRAQAAQRLRLLSSDGDPFLASTRALSLELRKRRIGHSLVVTPGGHDYAFNRGPAAVELLRFHDRALRELPAP